MFSFKDLKNVSIEQFDTIVLVYFDLYINNMIYPFDFVFRTDETIKRFGIVSHRNKKLCGYCKKNHRTLIVCEHFSNQENKQFLFDCLTSHPYFRLQWLFMNEGSEEGN